MPISISLVDDNASFRAYLVKLIHAIEELRLVSEHSNGEDVEAILAHQPDVVLVELLLPGKNGAELIRALRTINPKVKCLVCTGFAEEERIFRALEAGAYGYILKQNTGEEIVQAIREVYEGGSPMSRPVARKVIESFHQGTHHPLPSLTEREKEIMELISMGMVHKEIALNLGVTRETIKKHMKNIFQKLGAQNKIEAINTFKKSKL